MDEIEQKIEESKLQLEETKLQLSDKIEILEQQVSQTVETASTAVAATVEAVQGTVESVTGVVEEAVHGVHEAFDFERQFRRHPFLILGGAVVAGYVAAQYFKSPVRRMGSTPVAPYAGPAAQYPYAPAVAVGAGGAMQQPTRQPLSAPAHHSSAWDGLKTLALSTLFGTMQGIALKAIPEVVGLVVGNLMGPQSQNSPFRQSEERSMPRARIWPEDPQAFPTSKSSEHVRSSKLS